jgi:hypothetical protein
VSASSSPNSGKSKAGGDVRGNPLFANTGGEKRKIRPPSSDPTALSAEQPSSIEESRPEPEAHSSTGERVSVSSPVQRRPPPAREIGETRFDEFYVKKTMHFIPVLLARFDALAKDQRKSKTRLFNEAIAGILDTYGALDEETREVLKEFGIEV